MRLPTANLLVGGWGLFTTLLTFYSRLATAEITIAQAEAQVQGAQLVNAKQAALFEPMTQWWRFNPEKDHNCSLQVLGLNWWGEHSQARYRVVVSADIGTLADQWGYSDKLPEIRRYYEKDMLNTWIKAFFEANRENDHPGQNPQAWLYFNDKWRHWEAYGDHSQYKVAWGKAEYINVNLRATRKWSDWTLNRCMLIKDF